MKRALIVLCIIAHSVLASAQLDTAVYLITDTVMRQQYGNDSLFYKIISTTGCPVLARIDSTQALEGLGLHQSVSFFLNGNMTETPTFKMAYTKIVDSLYKEYYAFPRDFVKKKHSRIHGDYVQYDVDHIEGKGLYEMYYRRPLGTLTIFEPSGKKVYSYACESHAKLPNKNRALKKFLKKLHRMDLSQKYSMVLRDKYDTVRIVYKDVSFNLP